MLRTRIAIVLLLLVILAGCEKRMKQEDAGLLAAARTGHANTVKDMIAAGANVNVKDEHGNTPLLEAARNGHDDVVRALLVAGANMKAKNDDGKTALMLALQNSHEDAVRALREAGEVE
jgi:ankyrin repeat protein